jgi:hypothetical protein
MFCSHGAYGHPVLVVLLLVVYYVSVLFGGGAASYIRGVEPCFLTNTEPFGLVPGLTI